MSDVAHPLSTWTEKYAHAEITLENKGDNIQRVSQTFSLFSHLTSTKKSHVKRERRLRETLEVKPLLSRVTSTSPSSCWGLPCLLVKERLLGGTSTRPAGVEVFLAFFVHLVSVFLHVMRSTGALRLPCHDSEVPQFETCPWLPPLAVFQFFVFLKKGWPRRVFKPVFYPTNARHVIATPKKCENGRNAFETGVVGRYPCSQVPPPFAPTLSSRSKVTTAFGKAEPRMTAV